MSDPTGASAWLFRHEGMPKDPKGTIALARTRIAVIEAEIPTLKKKMAMIKDLQVSNPAEYARYIETGKLKEYESQLSKIEVMLSAWRAAAADAEKDVPYYEGLVKKSDAWIKGHAKAEERAAKLFKSRIGAIQTEQKELLAGFGARGWAPPQGLADVRQDTFFLRVMVTYLGASPPPGMTYVWTLEDPTKRHYDL